VRGEPRRSGYLARVFAVGRRDLSIQFSYQFQFATRFLQVFFLLASLYFASKLVTDAPQLNPYGGDYFSFVLVGLIVSSFVTVGLGTFTRTLAVEQQGGTLELLLSTPTRIGNLLTGAMVMPIAMALISITMFVVIGSVLFDAQVPLSGIVLSIPLLVLTTLVFAAVGMFSCAFVVLTKRGDPFSALLGQASTFFAGALFPITVLPAWMQSLAKLVPAYYSLEGMRTLLLNDGGLGDVTNEMIALLGFAMALLPLAVIALRWALGQARVTGTLGTY